MELWEKYKTRLEQNGIDTPLRKAHFFAQLEHESGLKPQAESLYYRDVKRLRSTFYSPFKGKSDSFVQQYVKNTEKCANYVYANRGGNGDEKSGDGFKYRGRGFIQLTFKDQYKKCGDYYGVDYLNNPDLLLTEADAMLSAIWYWKVNNLNKYADINDIDGVSDVINMGRKTVAYGDSNGFTDRHEKFKKYVKIFNVK